MWYMAPGFAVLTLKAWIPKHQRTTFFGFALASEFAWHRLAESFRSFRRLGNSSLSEAGTDLQEILAKRM